MGVAHLSIHFHHMFPSKPYWKSRTFKRRLGDRCHGIGTPPAAQSPGRSEESWTSMKYMGFSSKCSLKPIHQKWLSFSDFMEKLVHRPSPRIRLTLRCWLVVGPPLWKIWVRQLGWLDTQYKIRYSWQPNHQPDHNEHLKKSPKRTYIKNRIIQLWKESLQTFKHEWISSWKLA